MLSIIIPTLNEEKILKKMILSLRELKDFRYEIIVSDGHSTDRTVEIAQQYADKVIIHDGKTRQTIGQGRTAGGYAASGEYLVFLDADVFIPDINAFFKKAISLFEKDEKLVALTVILKTLPEYENFMDKVSWYVISKFHQFVNNVLKTGSSSGEFQMFRKDAFMQIGGYSKTIVFGEDAEIFYRMAKIGKVWLEPSLYVMHTSRRAHNVGWLHLWSLYTANIVSNLIRRKPVSKEWKVSR